MPRNFAVLLLVLLTGTIQSQRLRVSENNRFLVTEKGEPFFWAGDTAWELFHRCTQEEATAYLSHRAKQGFNVVQAVALAELDGLNTPNRYGELPLVSNDPARPNEIYFDHVDFVIKKAGELGIYIALLPTWGDKVFTDSWGVGPEIFTPENARIYGSWLGNRYKAYDNIIWIIGGDRNPRVGSSDVAVWNALAEGIAAAAGGYDNTLMSFHPQPTMEGGSSQWFHRQPWLDFNMHQTGHCADQPTYRKITHDYNLTPVKPVVDGEPLYEDHPNCFNARELGYSIPEDIRRIMYWNVFAGAFGQTYGCHDVWQMYEQDREGINKPLRPWPLALDLPMANQVKHLKNLMLSRPFLNRVPAPDMVPGVQGETEDYVIATADSHGSYAMVYFPTGKSTLVDFSNLTGKRFHSWWYDPRTGTAFAGPSVSRAQLAIYPPSSGKGQDWVLVVDDGAQAYGPPGKDL